MVEGLTVEELARLKALADRLQTFWREITEDDRGESGQMEMTRHAFEGLAALITQIERLTAERDEARRYRDIDAFGQAAEQARADTLAAENERLKTLISESILQIQYLHAKFKPTGTGNAVIARLQAALAAGEPAR